MDILLVISIYVFTVIVIASSFEGKLPFPNQSGVVKVSLVSLTFGNSKNVYKSAVDFGNENNVLRPLDGIAVKPNIANRVEVKRVCQFVGHNFLYVVGEVKEGVIFDKMKGKLGENNYEIVEVESKLAMGKAKKGMTVGLTITGISKDDIKGGEILNFSL